MGVAVKSPAFKKNTPKSQIIDLCGDGRTHHYTKAGIAELVGWVKKQRDDPEALAAWREAMTNSKGRPVKSEGVVNGDIISIKPERGNSREYTVSRLQKQRPDLFERVKAGEITAKSEC